MSDAQELAHLRARAALDARLDDALEAAVAVRAPLAALVGEALQVIGEALGADAAWVTTLDEELAPRTFGWPPRKDGPGRATVRQVDPEFAAMAAKAAERANAGGGLGADGRTARLDASAVGGPAGSLLLARRLDVAGASVGTLGVRVPGGAALDAGALTLRAELLAAAAEELDDTLALIHQERRKQRLLRGIHEALRHPLVHEGVRQAIERLAEEVSFDLVLVLYHLREDDREAIHYLVFRGPALEFGSGARVAEALDQALRRGRATRPGGAEVLVSNAEVEHRRVVGTSPVDLRLEGASDAILGSLGYRECHETVLIAGLDEEAIVGKLVVAARRPLGTFERDVLALLADVLQKRIVDYNAAGEALRRSFSLPTVIRLLDEERPWARLAPRAAEISILFADVAGFTALSERCLAGPTAVGDFVEAWSRGVTKILWHHGGVFDKLVGDCIIGLFGPPYFELTPAQRAELCVRAAVDMVRFTQRLIDHAACARIKQAGLPLGVAVGLNDGPASVGMFGLDQDYTAFSSAMNNTARLQGMATRDEVLVMAPMADTLEKADLGWRFGPRREGKAKNVAEPLVFRALELESVQPR